MTNREIKFELAKVALVQNLPMDSIKQMYEWIIEEPEAEEETTDKNGLDSINIKEVLNIIRKNQGFSNGIATSLETIFSKNNINTVGDLMRIGRCDFRKYRLVGKKSVWAIDDALEELRIKGW